MANSYQTQKSNKYSAVLPRGFGIPFMGKSAPLRVPAAKPIAETSPQPTPVASTRNQSLPTLDEYLSRMRSTGASVAPYATNSRRGGTPGITSSAYGQQQSDSFTPTPYNGGVSPEQVNSAIQQDQAMNAAIDKIKGIRAAGRMRTNNIVNARNAAIEARSKPGWQPPEFAQIDDQLGIRITPEQVQQQITSGLLNNADGRYFQGAMIDEINGRPIWRGQGPQPRSREALEAAQERLSQTASGDNRDRRFVGSEPIRDAQGNIVGLRGSDDYNTFQAKRLREAGRDDLADQIDPLNVALKGGSEYMPYRNSAVINRAIGGQANADYRQRLQDRQAEGQQYVTNRARQIQAERDKRVAGPTAMEAFMQQNPEIAARLMAQMGANQGLAEMRNAQAALANAQAKNVGKVTDRDILDFYGNMVQGGVPQDMMPAIAGAAGISGINGVPGAPGAQIPPPAVDPATTPLDSVGLIEFLSNNPGQQITPQLLAQYGATPANLLPVISDHYGPIASGIRSPYGQSPVANMLDLIFPSRRQKKSAEAQAWKRLQQYVNQSQ